MKVIALLLINLLIMTYTTTTIASEAKVKTVIFKCKEISCSGCKAHITESVKSLDGIKSVNVNIEKKTVKVKFDDTITSIEKIKEAIEEAGYSAEIVD